MVVETRIFNRVNFYGFHPAGRTAGSRKYAEWGVCGNAMEP